MASKPALAAAAAVCCALAVASTALASNGGIAPPDSATDSGSAINSLYWTIFGITAFIFLVVEAALITFIVRFRRRRDTPYETEGPQLHGNTRLEIIWTAIPVVILVSIMVAVFVTVPAVNANPGDGEEPLTVDVGSHQFYWEYEYPNGAISLDRLRIPVDTTISLVLTSPDVQHSWWVPTLTGKKDAIPGRTNVLQFKANRTGVFRGRCAEFCGIQHAVMYTVVEVVPQAEYEAWVADQAEAQSGGRAAGTLGKATFEAVCAKCHGFAGEGGIGPPIAGKVTGEAGLVQLLDRGQNTNLAGIMPPVGAGWPDRQVRALLAYLTTDPTLSGKGAG
jgi:cytochrome c oxidase subunit 2